MMHLISEMPEPAAYGAKDLTRAADTNAKQVYLAVSHGNQDSRAQVIHTPKIKYKK